MHQIYLTNVMFWREFNASNNLIRHQKTHTGETAYTCDVCGKEFTRSYGLKLQQLNSHKREAFTNVMYVLKTLFLPVT